MKKLTSILIALGLILLLAMPVYADWGGEVWHPKATKSAAPTVNDDTWPVYTIWVDETADKAYICVDRTPGAAVWNYIGVGPTTAENSGVTLTTTRFGEVIDINSGTTQIVYLPVVDSGDAGGEYHFNIIEGGVTIYSDTTNNTDYIHDSDIDGYIYTSAKGTLSLRLDISGVTWMITQSVGTWTTAP